MSINIPPDSEERIADYRWRAEHIQHPEGLGNHEDFLERTNFLFDPFSTGFAKIQTWEGKTAVGQVIEDRGDYALIEDAEALAKFVRLDNAGHMPTDSRIRTNS